MNALKVYLEKLKIGLVDVGARGGLEPRWHAIDSNIKVIMFEPDERSRLEIESFDYIDEIVPMGLGLAEGTVTLKLCRDPGVSSLLYPRQEFLSKFQNSKRFEVTSSDPIKITTLDKCLEGRESEIDFVKVDTQGTELDILKGGLSIINSSIIGLEIEIEFTQLYKDQPLFGDVCAYLERNDYEFFDFVNLCRWERNNFTLFGQVVFGDGLFLRTPEIFANLLDSLPDEQARSKARKYIAVVALYGHIDLLPVCIEKFEKFLNEADKKATCKLHKSLLKRRYISNFIIRFANRVLRSLGIQVIGLQKPK